jgi:hypothetical protein
MADDERQQRRREAALKRAHTIGKERLREIALKSLLQNRALSCGTGLLGYGWRV